MNGNRRMPSIGRLIFAALLAVMPISALAQDRTPGVFDDYDAMRATLDRLIMTRAVSELLAAFGGSDEMSPQDVIAVEAQLRGFYPNDFVDGAVMQNGSMSNGFQQQIIAYWDNEFNYIYVHLLLHDRGDDLVAIRMGFNTDINVFLPLF